MSTASPELTSLARASHIQCGGNRCPNCCSSRIDGDRLERNGSAVTQTVECAECNGSWTDVFRLVDVEGISV